MKLTFSQMNSFFKDDNTIDDTKDLEYVSSDFEFYGDGDGGFYTLVIKKDGVLYEAGGNFYGNQNTGMELCNEGPFYCTLHKKKVTISLDDLHDAWNNARPEAENYIGKDAKDSAMVAEMARILGL